MGLPVIEKSSDTSRLTDLEAKRVGRSYNRTKYEITQIEIKGVTP